MDLDWTAALSALVGAAVVAIVAIRWRTHSRSRSIHIEFDWQSRLRDDSTSTKDDDP